jgi:putative transposase
MLRKVKFAFSEYYHIYNKGVDGRDIFLDDKDHKRFLLLLTVCNDTSPIEVREIKRRKGKMVRRGETLTDIGAYCLLPNHFHMLVRERLDGGISRFIQKVSTAYTMYFNKRHRRSGPLFQGTFRSNHAEKDEYLKYLFSYIHFEPVRFFKKDWKAAISNTEKTIDFLKGYEYSSLKDYLEEKNTHGILNKNSFPDHFSSVDTLKNNLVKWLSFGG